MATKANRPKHGSKAKRRFYRRTVMDLKNRTRDLDRIQDDVKALAAGAPMPFVTEGKDVLDLPGAGQHYCVSCARLFVDAAAQGLHERTKDHKKQVRRVAQPQYTHAEANAGAGMSK